MPDDLIFPDRGIMKFEETAPGENIYLVPTEGRSQKALQYIESDKAQSCGFSKIQSLLADKSVTGVVFHTLPDRWLPLLSYINDRVSVAWIGWGCDFYSTLLAPVYPYPYGVLEPLTQDLAEKTNISFKDKLRAGVSAPGLLPGLLYRRLKKAFLAKPVDYSSNIYRIDIFSPILKAEWQLARKLDTNFKADYLPWSYATAERLNIVLSCPETEKMNILIGNSSTLTNNHFDAFAFIAKCGELRSSTRVIVPLSYGDKSLALKIMERGRYYFGDRFQPLTELLPLSRYAELVASCHTVMMNHARQQAMGNISIAALKGSRIVLNPRSLVTEELKSWGIHFQTTAAAELGPLNFEQRDRNREREVARVRYLADPDKTLSLVKRLTSHG